VPRLFDRGSAWARPVPGPAAAVHGAGLGLFIAGRLAEANGATLAYEPNIPAGSCFTLRLEAFRS
jgi:signal transduction histidine kinase